MKKFMKKTLILATTCLLAVTLGGCSKGDNKGTAGKDGELKKVSIQIDGAAVPYYAPLYLAQEKGFFAEEGLEVEFFYA
ncbi:MAG: ABC transporter substrate-binding protein, partial [Clostridium sp.]